MVQAQEAQWIWSPEHAKDEVPHASCFFRKSVQLRSPEQGQITIAADDEYELYVNGRRIGRGESNRRMQEYDIGKRLVRGNNTISIKVTNTRGTTAAVAARVMIKQRNANWQSFSTDNSWRTSLKALPLWNTVLYNDRNWQAAREHGRLGETVPWDRQEGIATEQTARSERFQISDEFDVERILDADQTGSLIALAFNEFGHAIASREEGPLLLLHDSDDNGSLDKVRVYCEEVTSCQGILPLNGDTYVTGNGPDGNGLYRLSDKDRNGTAETVELVLKFKGEFGEHGAHGLTLGPDGLIYIVIGNHSGPEKEYERGSPYQNSYEGDLVARYEDPGGHAVGIKAPGGVVIRTDTKGSSIQLVAGGLRNCYDLAFNVEGELFTHDSDMEADIGTTWYHPTRLYHVTPGAEFGWRSGWANWPSYFLDTVPPIVETGRGSPTGAVVYDHVMFPARYHNSLFLADWSEGRILAVTTRPDGATYVANTEVFLQGSPLNVTDLDVGPDGALYFVTGGRGTSGGLYRVRWKGDVPTSLKETGQGISAVIRQPQLHSAWARQKIAALKREMGEEWDGQVAGVAISRENPAHYRTRALDVLQLFGPAPSPEMLISLSRDPNEALRAKVVDLMGLYPSPDIEQRLTAMLADSDRVVRRKACEAMIRGGLTPPLAKLEKMLASDDRAEAFAARRLLERLPLEQWREKILATDDQRLFAQGALAMMVAHPNRAHALQVLERISSIVESFVSDRDFLDLLRVAEVALIRGGVAPNQVPGLRNQLAEEFPSGHPLMNRELTRLLAYLQADSILDRYLDFLNSDAPEVEKLHVAFHLRFIQNGWTAEQKLELLKFYEHAQSVDGGSAVPMYVINVTRDFVQGFTAEEASAVLAEGAELPNAALGALFTFPQQLDEEHRETLYQLDREIAGKPGEVYQRLRVGIVAVLARSGDEESMKYLRDTWEREPDRRETIAMGLAQQPQAPNWSYLLRSLPVLEGVAARDVLKQLATVSQRPKEGEYYRQAVLCGLRLQKEGGLDAVKLLEHWSGESISSDTDWEVALGACRQWLAKEFPELPAADLPAPDSSHKWQFEELLEYLSQTDTTHAASREQGREVFQKAQCAKCHRLGNQGETVGPDLTAIGKRFTRKEVLESIVYPSHVISTQYASKSVTTVNGQTYVGILAAGANGQKAIVQSDGKRIPISDQEIEEIAPSKISAMPAGLLDPLTLEEIADLFAYLGVPQGSSIARKK